MQTTGDDGDLLGLLSREDGEIQRLFDAFSAKDAAEDHTRRAAIGKELIDRLAVQDSVKEEIVHVLARDMGRPDLADQLDARSRERKAVLAELDQLSAAVSPRDLHQSGGERFDELVGHLGELVAAQVGYEREEVIPAIRQAVGPEELSRRGAELDRARGRASTHPRPDVLAHEQSSASKKAKAIYDRLRDVPDAPHHRPRPDG